MVAAPEMKSPTDRVTFTPILSASVPPGICVITYPIKNADIKEPAATLLIFSSLITVLLTGDQTKRVIKVTANDARSRSRSIHLPALFFFSTIISLPAHFSNTMSCYIMSCYKDGATGYNRCRAASLQNNFFTAQNKESPMCARTGCQEIATPYFSMLYLSISSIIIFSTSG